MLEILLLWGYMLVVNACVGAGILKLLYRATGRIGKEVEFVPAVMTGVVVITAYAEWFSIFGKVGMLAHLLLLAAAAVSAVWSRDVFAAYAKRFRAVGFSWEGVLYILIVGITAYCASRGLQHTDTGIYHAQMIRWYEEYGVVKGLGNLQQHFAYNSASLAYAAVFSMKWLVGQSLHGTTGFFQAFMTVWALWGLKSFKQHENNLTDACRVGILIYVLVNLERAMSPATDYSTMYLALYVVTRWAQLCSERRILADMDDYGLLCVVAVCVTTCKLSAGILVLLALYPGIIWIRNREWKKILFYLGAGILILAPWLIRNVILSGWLIYPFPSIDIFRVDWKIPPEYVQHDSDQIKVWGRCLFDVERVGAPIGEWLPVWWDAKDTYEKTLVYANLAAVLLELLHIFYCLYHRRKMEWEQVILHGAVFGSVAGWFLLAPFIRYGLAFLLMLPLLAAGSWLKKMQNGPSKIAAGFLCTAVFFFLCYYWSYYALYDMLWAREHLKDPAWVVQQDYDRVETKTLQVDSLTVSYPVSGDNISYHDFPGVAYPDMAKRTRMRGDSIEDGFMPR